MLICCCLHQKSAVNLAAKLFLLSQQASRVEHFHFTDRRVSLPVLSLHCSFYLIFEFGCLLNILSRIFNSGLDQQFPKLSENFQLTQDIGCFFSHFQSTPALMSSEECENDETRQVEIKLSTVEQYLKDMSLKN